MSVVWRLVLAPVLLLICFQDIHGQTKLDTFPWMAKPHNCYRYYPETECNSNCRAIRTYYCTVYPFGSTYPVNLIEKCLYNGSDCGESRYHFDNTLSEQDVTSNAVSSSRRRRRKHRRPGRLPTYAQCSRSQRRARKTRDMQPANKMLKILGGKRSLRNRWPWHVALINGYGMVYCGGTLIADNWVLTAAHCMRDKMIVRLGEHNIHKYDNNQYNAEVLAAYAHSNYNDTTVDSDIALLRIRGRRKSAVACLPQDSPKFWRVCTIVGWGKIHEKAKHGASFLREGYIITRSDRECRESNDDLYLTRNMFCAGLRSGHVDSCSGDSGGGLLCPHLVKRRNDTVFHIYTVDGITSFGNGCGVRGKYGIYTKVFQYIDWIRETITGYN